VSRGLIVFAREPVPGTVKTRLASDIGAEAATNLYRAMLLDVLELASGLTGLRALVFWSLVGDDLPRFPGFPQLEMHRQCGSDLGERMAAAFATAFSCGIRDCCIIGTDTPDLPAEHIYQAFAALEQDRADAVFGPARDGGYYLLGMKQVQQHLFEGIAWGTPMVLSSSLKRAAEMQLSTTLLPVWHDMDTLDDLKFLATTPGEAAPHTRAALRTLRRLPTFKFPKGRL